MSLATSKQRRKLTKMWLRARNDFILRNRELVALALEIADLDISAIRKKYFKRFAYLAALDESQSGEEKKSIILLLHSDHFFSPQLFARAFSTRRMILYFSKRQILECK